jgi:two-component system OmpR family response regulator
MPRQNTHILVVDDDREIRDLLQQFLGKHNYHVSTAEDGGAMWLRLNRERIDLIVLDLMLPGDGGLQLCQKLRADNDIPIIMLTALGEETDRIVGLEMGADDYLPKPFNPRELLARIKAVMRRRHYEQTEPMRISGYRFEGWELNLNRRELHNPDHVLVPLTAGEYELLVAFLEHPQRVLTRDQLLDMAKGRELNPFDRSIDVQVSRLRRKIEPEPKQPTLIKTVRSGGYLFTSSVDKT